MLPAWEISYALPSGGYGIATIAAATQAEAVSLGRKDLLKYYPNPKPKVMPNVIHKFGKKEELNLILDRIFQYHPEIYNQIYDSGITNGKDLIKKAKRKIGKDNWVWFR